MKKILETKHVKSIFAGKQWLKRVLMIGIM